MYKDLKEQYLDIIQTYMPPSTRNNMLANLLTLRNLAGSTMTTKNKKNNTPPPSTQQKQNIKPILVHDAAKTVLRMSTKEVKKTLDTAAKEKILPPSVVKTSKASIDKKGKTSWAKSMKKWSLSALVGFLLLSPQGIVQNYNTMSILGGVQNQPSQTLTQLGRTYISKNHGKNTRLLNGSVFKQHVANVQSKNVVPTKKVNQSNYASALNNTKLCQKSEYLVGIFDILLKNRHLLDRFRAKYPYMYAILHQDYSHFLTTNAAQCQWK